MPDRLDPRSDGTPTPPEAVRAALRGRTGRPPMVHRPLAALDDGSRWALARAAADDPPVEVALRSLARPAASLPSAPPLPAHLLAAAKRLGPRPLAVWMRVTLRRVAGAWEAMEVLGDLAEPAPVRRRAGKGARHRGEAVVGLTREIEGLALRASVTSSIDDRFAIVIDVRPMPPGDAPNLTPVPERATLLRGGRELSSVHLRHGRARLGPVRAGDYTVWLSDACGRGRGQMVFALGPPEAPVGGPTP